ncbi:MAG: hypothetical protein ABI384_05985 [Allobranchiibius sp.]
MLLGRDAGKEEHQVCGLDPDGNGMHDKPLPQEEGKLGAVFEKLAQLGTDWWWSWWTGFAGSDGSHGAG